MKKLVRSAGSISGDAAARMVEAAVAQAERDGVPSSVAVVDSGGHLVAFRRMDDSTLLTVEVAQNKAYSAALAGRATHVWQDIFAKEQPLASGIPAGVRRIVVFGGGYPLVVDGVLVGGIGASGGHYSQDMAVARAGLAWLESAQQTEADHGE